MLKSCLAWLSVALALGAAPASAQVNPNPNPISGLPIAPTVNPQTDYGVGVVQRLNGTGVPYFATVRVPLAYLVGPAGPANTLGIGTITTLPAGSAATASFSGQSPSQLLSLGLPAGATGPQGQTGPTGASGAPASFASVSATTLPPGSQATATLGGTGPSAYTITFGLPQGQAGTGNVSSSGTPSAGSIPIFVSYSGGIATIANATAAQIRNAAGAAASGANSDITSLSSLTSLTINKAASGQTDQMVGQTAGLNRWLLALGDGTSEAGSNSGSDFRVFRYADNGTYIDGPLSISRATGVVSVADGLSAPNVAFTSGTINGTSIGGSMPAAGAFTTLSATTPVAVASGGTGAASAAGARTALGAAASGANTDITSLASPALGSATATTQAAGDNSTKVATDAFVLGQGASASDVQTGTNATRYVTSSALAGSQAFQALAYAATISWNGQSGYNASVTLTGNATLGAITNPVAGQTYTLLIAQDTTGSRTLAYSTAYDFGASGTPTLTTTAGKADLLTLICINASTPTFYAMLNKGF